VRGERRNRGDDKREAKAMDVLVSGLTHMSKKQVEAISHLLTPSIIDNIGVAASLPRSNQGRKRQEDFIAKQIRLFVPPNALAKLNTAVDLAKEATSSFEDPIFANQADAWFDSLVLEGDDSTFDAVIQRAMEADVSLSWQDLKELVRSVQMSAQEEIEASRGGAVGTSNHEEEEKEAGMDPELREILASRRKTDLGAKRRAAQRSRNSLRKTLLKIAESSLTRGEADL
jgi:ribosomal 50S subunit-associated protein YjgA (DUF615 family)